MPPKKSSTAAPTEGSRRSSRIAGNSPPEPSKKKAPVKAAAKKRSKDETEADVDEPVAKKAKAGSKKTKADLARAVDDKDESGGEEKKEDEAPASGDADTEEQPENEEKPAPASTKQLEIGDTLPDLTLQNEKGEDVNVKDLAGEKQGVVFFLVPKADTPGCTRQACAFRDSYADFTGVDYAVYCLSADPSAAQAKWQAKKELPYPLLSDPKRIFIEALGALKPPKSTKRSHVIFEKGSGKLVEKKITVKPDESSKLALEFIKSHHGGTTSDAIVADEPTTDST